MATDKIKVILNPHIRLPRRLLEIGFHLLYHQLAWSYDLIAWSVSFGQWADWRRLALPFLQPGKTLELAYGTGGFFIDMLDAGHNPVGIDLSPYMARMASRRLRSKNYAVPLSQSKAQALPFPSDYFTNIVATFPTNYILQKETLAEIRRVLKNDTGQLIIVFEGRIRGIWPIRTFIDWLYKVTEQQSLPHNKVLSQMDANGFTARWEMVDIQGVSAHLLLAELQK